MSVPHRSRNVRSGRSGLDRADGQTDDECEGAAAGRAVEPGGGRAGVGGGRGDGGLVHALRGRASNNKTAVAARSAVLKAYRLKYAGFGPTLACEYLLKDAHAVAAVSHDTLGRWLREEGLFEKRRKRGKHRLRRPRRRCLGELVQMDGSWHDWLEGRGPWCCLMGMIDDATGRVRARF